MPIDSEPVAEFATRLGTTPSSLRPKLRVRLKAAAEPVRAGAERRASWSTRIPKSLVIRTRFTGRRTGVWIVARKAVAPHARAFEGISEPGAFRHPVFGNRDAWVSQQRRPFLFPAARAAQAGVKTAVAEAVADVHRSLAR